MKPLRLVYFSKENPFVLKVGSVRKKLNFLFLDSDIKPFDNNLAIFLLGLFLERSSEDLRVFFAFFSSIFFFNPVM